MDEQRRALLCDASLKSMDFIVYAPDRVNLLVDVKGRRFPSGGEGGGSPGSGHKWENWATQDDLDSLTQWERVFGPGFRAALVFAYHVLDPRWLGELEEPFRYRNRVYAFYGVWADEYATVMRTRSPSWETVSLPLREYERLRRPIEELL